LAAAELVGLMDEHR